MPYVVDSVLPSLKMTAHKRIAIDLKLPLPIQALGAIIVNLLHRSNFQIINFNLMRCLEQISYPNSFFLFSKGTGIGPSESFLDDLQIAQDCYVMKLIFQRFFLLRKIEG